MERWVVIQLGASETRFLGKTGFLLPKLTHYRALAATAAPGQDTRPAPPCAPAAFRRGESVRLLGCRPAAGSTVSACLQCSSSVALPAPGSGPLPKYRLDRLGHRPRCP